MCTTEAAQNRLSCCQRTKARNGQGSWSVPLLMENFDVLPPKAQMCMLYGASTGHFYTAHINWCSIWWVQTRPASFLSREKLHPERKTTKGIGFVYAECFLYIRQKYKFTYQWAVMICQSHRIISGWAVRLCCADLHQYGVNFLPILEVLWTLIVRHRMRDRKTNGEKRFWFLRE